MSYTLVKFDKNTDVLTVRMGNRTMGFTLPRIDDLLPEGEALTAIIEDVVNRSTAPLVTPADNANSILSLINPTIDPTQIRMQRNRLLSATDPTQVADSPLSVELKNAWATYRSELRALPEQPLFPVVTWPVPPAPITRGEGKFMTDEQGVPVL